MVATRKTFTMREKDLKSAILKIKHGRSKFSETSLSVAAVAREAGVSTALIYNHYPHIAESIREAKGRTKRIQQEQKKLELKNALAKCKELRSEITKLTKTISKLASINETLLIENEVLKSKIPLIKVTSILPSH
ncbi:TetR/AcrR family transcriptional regulator [Pseudomonas shirazensis]|uniref:TetR/AcrR family transcriptional regulator n=1 Tax=Pseudomonas shirazensis TaxID=2745494 RepID=A0ABU9A8U2_9PSED